MAFLAILAINGYGQNKGSLTIDQDSRVEKLLKKQRDVFAANSTMSGYRVQIFMEIGNEAIRHAEAMKRSFTEAFPNCPSISHTTSPITGSGSATSATAWKPRNT